MKNRFRSSHSKRGQRSSSSLAIGRLHTSDNTPARPDATTRAVFNMDWSHERSVTIGYSPYPFAVSHRHRSVAGAANGSAAPGVLQGPAGADFQKRGGGPPPKTPPPPPP